MTFRSMPGLRGDGRCNLHADLNMAAQCLAHSSDALSIIDLTSGQRRDVSYGNLSDMTDGLARALGIGVWAGDRVGVLLSQSPWCAAAHLAIWKIGAISVSLFKFFQQDALVSQVGDAGCRIVLTVITSAGYRIGPAEIEDCLLTHPGVAPSGVVGKPDALRTEIVKAYAVRRPGADTDATALHSWVEDRLASFSYQREIFFGNELPMTVTGKVIRKELKRRAAHEKKEIQ